MAEMLEVVMRDNGFSCGGIKQAVRGRSQPGQWVSSTAPSPPPAAAAAAAAAGPFQTAPELSW